MDHHYLVRKILLKYHRGEPLTEEEQALLDAELANLPADRVWERVRSHVENEPGRVVVMRPWYVRWPAVTAGAAAVVMLIAGGLYRNRAQSDRTVAVQVSGSDAVVVVDSAAGGRSNPYRVSLPDGSTVTLSYGSSIRYAKAFEQRRVILAGQAYFDVAKRENPFIVESGNTTVQVLGTKFNWMHYPGVPDEITLLNGKIRLSRGNFQRVLAPGERAVIHEGSPIRVQWMKSPEESVAWMGVRPSIEFDSTDLYTVIQRMAQYYGVGYSIDPRLRSGYPVKGTMFLQQSLDQNIAWMAGILKSYARIEKKDGMIQVRE